MYFHKKNNGAEYKEYSLGMDSKAVNRKMGWGQLESNHPNLLKERVRSDEMVTDILSLLIETTVNTYRKQKQILKSIDSDSHLSFIFNVERRKGLRSVLYIMNYEALTCNILFLS